MKISRGVIILCVLTLIALSYESEYKNLTSIDDLKTVYSEKSLPMHSLILLHWFADTIDIDNNNVVRLSFDPNADFGSHYYGNYDGLLAPVLRGYKYYTVGTLTPRNGNMCPRARDFPPYVIHPRVIEPADMGWNRDRIIVQAQNYESHGISQIYLTQHFRRQDNQGSRYDPDHTFEISTDLLRQLRLFSFNNNNPVSLQELRNQFNQNIDDTELNDVVNIWGRDQARLGLLFLIVTPQRANLVGVCRTSGRWVRDITVTKTGKWQNCELQKTYLYVKTGSKGKAKILWKNVPQNQLNEGAAVVLFKNQMDQDVSSTYTRIKNNEGSYDTSVTLNEGLQVRLHKAQGFLSTTIKEEICRGEEFKSPHAVPVTGYAQLKLFVRKGKACFLLYVRKGCHEWKSDFYHSWVGLYKPAEEATKKYMSKQWQWVIYFDQALDSDDEETFEYCTGTTITPGLQARFIIKHYNEKARTPVWV